MRVLVLGSGGREHALCWKISHSPLLEQLYCAPGNPGISAVAQCVDLNPDNHSAVVHFCKDNQISLVIVGPEAPLVNGIADILTTAGIACFGPSADAAQIEGSKRFAKELCKANTIPTAAYAHFTDAKAATAYIQAQGAPIVVKADGLAAGKGVTVAQTEAEAIQAVEEALDGAFGEAGNEVIIEGFLEGEEASFFALVDGDTILPLGYAQDHKAVGEGDTGPNTGGMGTYSPTSVITDAIHKLVMDSIVIPSAQGMVKRGTPYRGMLFVGLMLTQNGPQVIEYNARFGDPETQVLLPRMESDLLEYLYATATGGLQTLPPPTFSSNHALCVVMATQGYPGSYKKGSEIRDLDAAAAVPDILVFHAGTKLDDDRLLANGGRVLGITAQGSSVADAQQKAYQAVDAIDWPEGYFRRDIGWRAIKKAAA